MEIKVYGIGCEKHRQLVLNLKQAAMELDIQPDIQEIRDIEEIAEAGFASTPGLVIDGEPLCAGEVLSIDELTVIISRYLRMAE